MSDRVSADIIPFPSIRPAVAASTPDDRLAVALRSLSAALVEQQQAVQTWREALAELAASMRVAGANGR